jgi:LPS sulfotransferase NodH
MNNFIIVGTQRTGSSAIAESLGIHPMITCGWEWTLKISRNQKFNAVDNALIGNFDVLCKDDQEHLAAIHDKKTTWIGFRWLFSSSNKWIYHPRYSAALWLDRLEDFIQWVSKRTNIHIIHIVRNDCMDWLKSIYIAHKVKMYSKTKYPDGITVNIPLQGAIRRLKAKNWVDYRLDSLKHTNPFHNINYEDFQENKNAVLSRVLEFLKCTPNFGISTQTILKKQSKGNASDYILNYNKLLEVLSKKNLLFSNYHTE